MKNIKYPNPWKRKVFKENRFRTDIGTVKVKFTQSFGLSFFETENEAYVNGYKKAINDVKLLNI